MAQQIINTGNTTNDGTGESLRDAFTAVNDNFSEIYAAGPVDSNVVISGNTIGVIGTNNNLVLAGNGIGNIQANSTIVPSINAVYDIGAANAQFDTVYSTYFSGNGSLLTGVTGIGTLASLSVTGNITGGNVLTGGLISATGNITGGNLVASATVRLFGYTVATLPTAGTVGRTAYVTDAVTPTYLGALVGGGAVRTPVFDNGTAWVSY